MLKCCSRESVHVMEEGLRECGWLQIHMGERTGTGLGPNKWQQIFQNCNKHILVEVTVWGIFTKISMRIACVWYMILHCVPEWFQSGLWHCFISQKNYLLGYDTVLYPRMILSWVMTVSYSRRILSCIMMLHHILEEIFPELWCCVISQKNIILSHTAVKPQNSTK
jgi:hypothetical protein